MRLFIFITLLVFSIQELWSQKISHFELIGRISDRDATLQMEFSDSAEVRLVWDTTSGKFFQQSNWVSFFPNIPNQIYFNNLQPNTHYYYRVEYKKPGSSIINNRPEYQFQTARPAGSAFTFVVQADPHMDEQSDSAVYLRCLKNQLEDNPDFMIDLGDILMSDKLRNSNKQIPRDTVTYRSHLMRSYYESIGHSVPLYIAIGNHEGESGWYLPPNGNNVAVWGTLDRKKYFLNPSPNHFFSGDTSYQPFVGQRESYFSWTWGDALFVILDPYWNTKVKPDSLNGWRWTLGKQQYDWLKSTLENSTSKYKFIFCHHLIGGDKDGRGGIEIADKYEWGGNNLNGSYGFDTQRPGWHKPIKELLKDNRATIFFHGHDHFFGKQDRECMVYQEVPQPSHPNFTSVAYAENYGYFQGQILPNSGHLRVSVAPEGVKVEYVRVYLPKSENATRKNKDVSATYFIGAINCYDSLPGAGISPVVWNANYLENLVYPNPSSQEVNLEFNVPEAGLISVNIFDLQGKSIKTLLQKCSMATGKYIIHWDGKNQTGNYVVPGEYLYSIDLNQEKLHSGKLQILH